jgi:HAD superfamily hydrolase (TIGR01484 family)
MEKLHLIFADTRERDCREKELQQMFPNLSICHATPFNIEIISGRAGKGNALVALGKILGIKREEIMACGDAPNDWNMLEMAGLPVVMANAG